MTEMLRLMVHLTHLNLRSTDFGVRFVKSLNTYGQPVVSLTTLILSSQYAHIDVDIIALERALQLLPALKVLNMQDALGGADGTMMVLKSAPESLIELNLAYNSFYDLCKDQDEALSALKLCLPKLSKFKKLTSVVISDPFNTKYSLVCDTNMPPTIVLSDE
jgi:hypothetical protein